MQGHGPFTGEHQKRALRNLLHWEDGALRTRSGKTIPDVAKELGISRTTLDRYISGKTPLSSDQFGLFAHALEVDKADLIRACFPTLTASRGPTFRERLEIGHVPENEIREVLSEALGKDLSPGAQARIAQIVIEDVEQRADDQEQGEPQRATS